MYEHYLEPLVPQSTFSLRVVKAVLISVVVVSCALGIGVFGYHIFEGYSWIDSILNASMILGGMGPVNELHTDAGKLFASGYALFSGVVFLVVAGILFAPIVHRFLHRFHLDLEED